MPGAEWFPGAKLNYAEHVLKNAEGRLDEPAILHQSEVRSLGEVSWGELRDRTAALAAASGRWAWSAATGSRPTCQTSPRPSSACSPAPPSARCGRAAPRTSARAASSTAYKQIEPKVLLAVDGYRYGGKDYDRTEVVARLQQEIPTDTAAPSFSLTLSKMPTRARSRTS